MQVWLNRQNRRALQHEPHQQVDQQIIKNEAVEYEDRALAGEFFYQDYIDKESESYQVDHEVKNQQADGDIGANFLFEQRRACGFFKLLKKQVFDHLLLKVIENHK